MSDILKAGKKITQGAEWRGTINVSIDGEMYELTVRQLRDDELYTVMSSIDRTGLQNLKDDLPEDATERYRELQEKEDLSEDEEEELQELQEQIEERTSNIFEVLDEETFKAVKYAGKKGVVPDDEDIENALELLPDEQKEMFGETYKTREEAEEVLNSYIEDLFDMATDFVSFSIGMRVIRETRGNEGN